MLTNKGKNCFGIGQVPRVFSAQEASLEKAAQQGNLDAFNKLVLANQDDLYEWVFTFVQDEQTAEAVTQQVFITAYQEIHSLHDESFRTWIFRIARDRSIEETRGRRRHPLHKLVHDRQDEDTVDLIPIAPAKPTLPEEVAFQSEQVKWEHRLLEKLPDHFRQALLLVELFEMDYQEAAAVLNLPVGTLKSCIAHARLRLHGQMEVDLKSL